MNCTQGEFMEKRNFLLIIILILLNSCAHVNRSPESGYSSIDMKSSSSTATFLSGTRDLQSQKTLAELGMSNEDLMTPEGQQKFQEAVAIKSLELQLVDEREKKQYFQNIPWFKDTHEQLEFLKQNGYYARQTWLRKKGIGKRPVEIDKNTEDLIAAKDIALGMPLELVKRSWGNPDFVEVAGNVMYGNQRWRYKRYTPSPEGYRLQSRIIYFESGKVAGWEQVDH